MARFQAFVSQVTRFQTDEDSIYIKVSITKSKLGFTSCSTATVILGRVLSIATCGTRTHRGD